MLMRNGLITRRIIQVYVNKIGLKYFVYINRAHLMTVRQKHARYLIAPRGYQNMLYCLKNVHHPACTYT